MGFSPDRPPLPGYPSLRELLARAAPTSDGGLLLPPEDDGPPIHVRRQLAQQVPDELRPPRPELLLPKSSAPQAADLMLCAPTLKDIDLPPVPMPEIVRLLGELPFWAAMGALARLAGELYHHARNRDRQRRLAVELYGTELGGRVAAFMDADDSHLAFDARHVAALQRLLVIHGGEDEWPEQPLSPHQIAQLACALIALASALPSYDPPEPHSDDEVDWAAWAAFTVQVGLWHDEPYIVEAAARAHALYRDVHGSPAVADAAARCDIEGWLKADYRLTLGQQLAGGLAAAVVTHAWDASLMPSERGIDIGVGFLSAGAMADHETALRDLISADRQHLRDLIAGEDPERVAFDHTVFERTPLLRAPDGRMRLVSPRFLVAWMTRGMHHRALQAAERRPHPKREGDTYSGRLLTYTGALGEEAARRVISKSHDTQREAGLVAVHGEREFFIGRRRMDSPDCALAYAEDVVLVEAYSGRISLAARAALDPAPLVAAIDRATGAKLTELAARTDDLLAGDLTYPGLDVSRVRRIWPVLVLAGDAIVQTQMLWGHLRASHPTAFRSDPRVQRPVICDLDDLEPLLALVQEGHLLPALLADLLASPEAELPPRNWVHRVFSGVLARPAYVEEQFEAAMNLAGSSLYPNSPRWSRPSARETQAAVDTGTDDSAAGDL